MMAAPVIIQTRDFQRTTTVTTTVNTGGSQDAKAANRPQPTNVRKKKLSARLPPRVLSDFPFYGKNRVRRWKSTPVLLEEPRMTMSHHSDDAMLIASSDSFWEPGNYKRTTKRIEDGFRLCNDLIQLIQERSEIEKAYAKSLKGWSKKWNEIIEKGPEYGTTEAAWKGVLVEADRRCELHTNVKDRLLNEVQVSIKQWQKDNYHRSMMNLKEKKEMEDQFKKAQKPWAKRLEKVNKAKIDYHTACKNERSAINQEKNAASDSSLSPDQIKKLLDRVQKSKEEVQRSKERYEAALHEIKDFNPKYMEDMTVVFEKCQEMENRRLKFFQEMLFGVHDCLNVAKDPSLPQIYEEYRHTIQNADSTKDLKWWSNNHGVAMAMNWPQFEDYSEEFREIIRQNRRPGTNDSGITLINQRMVGDDHPDYSHEIHNISKKPKMNASDAKDGVTVTRITANHKSSDKDKKDTTSNRNSTVSTSRKSYNPFQDEEEDEDERDNNDTTALTTSEKNGKPEGNPFEEDHDEWDEDTTEALVDNGEPGVPVKALYDYEGAEADELTFKQGETFEKLEDEDEQGWCKGRKNGRVGLYPANYVEVIP